MFNVAVLWLDVLFCKIVSDMEICKFDIRINRLVISILVSMCLYGFPLFDSLTKYYAVLAVTCSSLLGSSILFVFQMEWPLCLNVSFPKNYFLFGHCSIDLKTAVLFFFVILWIIMHNTWSYKRCRWTLLVSNLVCP